MLTPDTFSRVSKYFVDAQHLSPEVASRRLAAHKVALVCGPEVADSPTLQAAVLTAANIAARCFPGGVRYFAAVGGPDPPLLLPWPRPITLAQAVAEVAGTCAVSNDTTSNGLPGVLIFGSRLDWPTGLQVTFNGWTAAVGPAGTRPRLPEHEQCVLAGMAAGALAVSETFMAFAGTTIEATHRTVGLSLWRPDLPWDHSEAIGVPMEYLPGGCWVLGLGHLGQAYLWALGLLPFPEPPKVQLMLQDYDRVVPANWDTGLLTSRTQFGWRKTRVAEMWLRSRGFDPAVIAHPFDQGTRRYFDEPPVALCGFDGKGPRHLLDQAGFDSVIECGLGGTAANFDAISLHTLPCGQTAARLWPMDDPSAGIRAAEVLAAKNPIYQQVHACGRTELAGRSVAVPFVGAISATLVMAELLRMFHDGEAYASLDMRMETPCKTIARLAAGGYRGMSRPSWDYFPVMTAKGSG